jgi:SEC-C motif-containing protein
MPAIRDRPCPCGSGRAAADCCEPFLLGHRRPETAEQLMRSRYTAYAQGAEDYLLRTWHPATRPVALGLAAAGAVKWLELKVLRVEGGEADGAEGRVEFVARYKPAGPAARLHETSRFVREHGQWFYVDGVVTGAGGSGR